MIQVNGFLCHNIAMKTEGNCDEIWTRDVFGSDVFGHDVFGNPTFSYKTKVCPLHVRIECRVTHVIVIRF